MAKRGSGEGTISKRPDGTWWARITVGYNDEGKQKRKAFYGKTRKEVSDQLKDAIRGMDNGACIAPSKITVEGWIRAWMKEYKKRSLKASSYSRMYEAATSWIQPHLGQHKLKDLSPIIVQRFINDMDDSGLATGTITKVHGILKAALAKAVDNGLIAKNAAQEVQLPRKGKKEIRVLSPDEQNRFIEAAKNSYLGDLFILMLATGLRIGEAIALT